MFKFLDLDGVDVLKQKIINEIPTKVSQLENDSGFITDAGSSPIQNCETTFQDNVIIETTENYIVTTTFNDDGNIVEVYEYTNGDVYTKTTTFNSDGSISEVVS